MDVSTIPDTPIDDASLFGFEEKSDEICSFLISDKATTPLVIAIHGEWGSGKSSLLLTTKRKIDEKIEKEILTMETMYFDAWQYEGSYPAISLMYAILKKIVLPQRNIIVRFSNFETQFYGAVGAEN